MEPDKRARHLIAAAGLAFATAAGAGPADKVYMPSVEAGETEIEFRGGYHDGGEADNEHQYVLDVGHGINSRWFTEVAAEFEKVPGADSEFAALEWENIFLLTEPGRHWLDVGLFAKYEYSLQGGPDEIVFGPLLQKGFGRVQANFNPLVERQIGSGAADAFEFRYAAQLKWRLNPGFEPGVQAFGGASTDRVGPALFGRWASGRHKFKYDAAVLFGVGSEAPDATVRFQFEYEI